MVRVVKQRMGIFYYLTPWLRTREFNRWKISIAVESELEQLGESSRHSASLRRQTPLSPAVDNKHDEDSDLDHVYEYEH